MRGTIVSKELYISDKCHRLGYTPENDYDPRYYDLGSDKEDNPELYNEILSCINNECGLLSYQLMCWDEVIYTHNYDVMKLLQDGFDIDPMWFDVAGDDVSTVDELHNDSWVW